MYELVGYMPTKYGYIGYFLQKAESEEQIHTGLRVMEAYIKGDGEPEIGGVYNTKYYEKTGKYYAFKRK